MTLHVYWTTACPGCSLKPSARPAICGASSGWEQGGVLEAVQERLMLRPRRWRCGGRRSSIRSEHQGVDGVDAFSDEDLGPGQHRDEPPCAGLHSEASDEGVGHRSADGRDAGMRMGRPVPEIRATCGLCAPCRGQPEKYRGGRTSGGVGVDLVRAVSSLLPQHPTSKTGPTSVSGFYTACLIFAPCRVSAFHQSSPTKA